MSSGSGTINGDFLFSTPFVRADWIEAMSLFSPAQLMMGRRKSFNTITAYVEDFDKLKNCIRFLMGSSHVDQTLNLTRDLPARHPIFQNLYAQEVVSLVGVEPNGKETPVPLRPQEPLLFDIAKYNKFRVEVSFGQFSYVIDADSRVQDLVGGEFQRFTTITSKPYLENLVLEGGQLVFETWKNWGLRPIMSNKPIVRQSKTAYTVTTYLVPLDLIANTSGTYPRFDAAIGKLNQTVFLGKDIGTMMLDTVDIDIYTDPIESDLTGTVARFADVAFTFKFFDPPRGEILPNVTDPRQGWNLWPAYDGLYYWAKSPDTGQPYFSYYEHNSLLRSWQAP